ncbi:MAG: aquaporin, partial [Balneolaceae bacterium]
AAAGRLQPGTLWTYLVSQVAGAFTGCLLIYFMTGTVFQTAPSSAASPFQYITVELLFAFLLCMVYLMLFLTRNFRNNQVYGLAIGLSYAGILMVGQPVTGGVFNPAVSLAVTFVDSFSLGGSYLYLPAYILAPSAGGIIAGNLFVFLVRSDHLLPEEV